MNDPHPVVVYISAAADLMAEREALARMIAALPVTVTWRVIQSPLGEELLDLAALAAADLHVLVMGSDIRAPVGLELLTARRAGRPVTAFLKQVTRTPAGQSFIRDAGLAWREFQDTAGLSRQVQVLLAEHLNHHALRYALSPAEVEQLTALVAAAPAAAASPGGEEAGRSAVILSRERFRPSDGVILGE